MSILEALGTPAFNAEKTPPIEIERYRLKITGLVEKEKEFTLSQIKKMPFSRVNSRLASVSGWSVRADWDGVLWNDFLKFVEPTEKALFAVFKSHGGYETTVSLTDLNHPRAMLVYGVAGEPLEHKHGGPLRTVLPHLWGYKSCKWLVEIEFTNKDREGYWESKGYSSSGYIEPGWTVDINTRTRRPIKGGEILDF